MTIKEKEILEELEQAQTFIENCEKARDFGLGLDEATYEKYNYAISHQIELGKQLEALKNIDTGFYTSAQLRRKEPELHVDRCKVEAVVELDQDQFHTFQNHMVCDYDFIHEHLEYMYRDRNGVSHCLLVLCEGKDDGVLIESEGYDYARYSALLPNARDYMQKQIKMIAEKLINQLENNSDRISFNRISILFDTEIMPQNYIGQMLISEFETNKTISNIRINENGFELSSEEDQLMEM